MMTESNPANTAAETIIDALKERIVDGVLGAKSPPPPATTSGKSTSPPLTFAETIPIALNIGWTMAVLYGFLTPGSDKSDRLPLQLPTEHELSEMKRVDLEFDRLDSLLKKLGTSIAQDPGHPLPADATALRDAWQTQLGGEPSTPKIPVAKESLRVRQLEFNAEILSALACAGRELELAYQLGRSLRDTVNPPVSGDRGSDANLKTAMTAKLDRRRISKLQEWLVILSQHLPADSAVIVGASMGRWSDFSYTVLKQKTPGRLKGGATTEAKAREFLPALLDQGDVWLNLLTGAQSTAGLLTPESYVAAGEASLSRTARIIRRVALHYWFLLLILAVALGAILWASAVYMAGTAKVWTQIAAIASALGVSAKGIGSTIARLSEAAERPVYQAEKLDAMAWAATTLPEVRISNRGVRALRRSGIQRSASLSRV
jgi:hypothetical protein